MEKPVTTKQELLDRMFELLDEADAVEWPSQTPYTFIQHMAAWLDQAHTRDIVPAVRLGSCLPGCWRRDEDMNTERRQWPNPALEPTRFTRYDLPMSRRSFHIAGPRGSA